MTVSMRVMSAGDGYKYLLRSVVASDGDRSLSTPLTRYYAEEGTPPGRWTGSSLAAFGHGQIRSGDQVKETQLSLLIGMGRDPVTGEGLGRAYPVYRSTKERVEQRVKELDAGLSADEREVEVARIEAEEVGGGGRRPVAGYDLTFSVPKSVSVFWGLAGANLQEMILAAHHAAVGEVIGFLEREIAATRTGVAAGDGAVAQVAVNGVAAAAFDHWESRSGDPQLHTHVVISNKVQALLDGRWRSLDGRPMHAAVTALSTYYDALLTDRLTGMLGVGWEMHVRGTNMHPHAEITGVPYGLIEEFSSRTRDIDRETERLVGQYLASHGHAPPDAVQIRLRAQATLTTRQEKEVRSLADLTDDWRRRAAGVLGSDPAAWARAVAIEDDPATMHASDIPAEVIQQIGAVVVTEVGRRRATWRHWNLWAEASRATMHWRFARASDREQIIAQIVEAAERRSVLLTPPEHAPSPPEFRRDDGRSVCRPRHAAVYSSSAILAAEDRLLTQAEDRSAPRVRHTIVDHVACREHDGYRLTATQVEGLDSVATSGRRLDVLVGPAGAGKTTAMRALRMAWELQHGPRSVVGLAPSAAAAAVLASDLGILCENTAMWLTQVDLGREQLRHGQLVIVDEATLADTATLDRLTLLADDADAKVLLVGDWAQLQSVDAGGAFGMLAQARPDVSELSEIHRFTHDWERVASLDLRAGRAEAIAAYARHDRLEDGTTEEVITAAYSAWLRDSENGYATVLVAESTDMVQALNTRARADRILRGVTAAAHGVALVGGTHASTGDQIITRRNDRTLRTPSGLWVRNGDLWAVVAIQSDGSMVVHRRVGRRRASVVLPAAYVAEHVDLGYAITAHRAQGLTVDTAHVIVTPKTAREHLYVAMTRGRDSNKAYVALDQPDEIHASPLAGEDVNARTVLYSVLRHTRAELSAHQAIAAEQEAWTSIAQLAAEYDTIAAAAQRPRWDALLRRSGLTETQTMSVISGDSFGPLTSALRSAEAHGHDVDHILPCLVARGELDDAEDIGAVLQHRLRLSTMTERGKDSSATMGQTLIAGLIPEAHGPMAAEMKAALDHRAELIESRAAELAEAAMIADPAWLRRFGPPPTNPESRRSWLTSVATVVAYRDRYQITSDLPLGPGARTEAERSDRRQALAAQRRATVIAGLPGFSSQSAPIAARSMVR
jgi:conjugative relaxase-like TrwC/TraI family protein